VDRTHERYLTDLLMSTYTQHEAIPQPQTIEGAPILAPDGSLIIYELFALCHTCELPIVSEDYLGSWKHLIKRARQGG
jgi:hypothetical protein